MGQRRPVSTRVVTVRFIVAALLFALGGCVHLEVDREAGTAAIPTILHNGTPLDLKTIYDNAGVTLDVEDDDVVNVGARPGVSCITDAELDSLRDRTP